MTADEKQEIYGGLTRMSAREFQELLDRQDRLIAVGYEDVLRARIEDMEQRLREEATDAILNGIDLLEVTKSEATK